MQGSLIGGVAHPWCGVFGEDHFLGRPRFRGEVALDGDGRRHALGGRGARPVCGRVRRRRVRGRLGRAGTAVCRRFSRNSIGPTPAATPTSSASNCSPVTVSTQPGRRPMASRIFADVFAGDHSGGLSGGDGGQQRRQRFTGQAPAAGRDRRFGQPPLRFARRQAATGSAAPGSRFSRPSPSGWSRLATGPARDATARAVRQELVSSSSIMANTSRVGQPSMSQAASDSCAARRAAIAT